jgi:2-polyprenyl-3-methyl-5-hydroxy-6-metoxy-1,4-benzoquinol methylase
MHIDLNYPDCLAAAFPSELPLAVGAVDDVLRASASAEVEGLAEHSPGLTQYEWHSYLRCSIVRMCHALSALARLGVHRARVLDYGSYFGNFSLMLQRAGHDVTAADAYAGYGAALEPITALLHRAGVTLLDFDTEGRNLETLPDASFDAILCMGVIEHVPHTPRLLLEALQRLLTPGGVLLTETPNLGYLYNRQRLARGEPIMTPLEAQYYTKIPFEGHHREYTPQEVVWMVQRLGHNVELTALYNYSLYAQERLSGRDALNFERMSSLPAAREVVLVASRRPGPGEPFVEVRDWTRTLCEEAPATALPLDPGLLEQLVITEPLLATMQQQITLRDEMLQQLQRTVNEQARELARRDATLAELQTALARDAGRPARWSRPAASIARVFKRCLRRPFV